jgi:hypothetical protein
MGESVSAAIEDQGPTLAAAAAAGLTAAAGGAALLLANILQPLLDGHLIYDTTAPHLLSQLVSLTLHFAGMTWAILLQLQSRIKAQR